MMRVAAALSALFVMLALGGMDPVHLETLGFLTLSAVIIGVCWDIIGLLVWCLGDRPARGVTRRGRRKAPLVVRKIAVRPTIIVDGSNIMHWSGEPSARVLNAVIALLREKGHFPHVWFDANAGYKLSGAHMSDWELAVAAGVKKGQISVSPSGEPADPHLLADAQERGIPVLSNDRFRDWTKAYPLLRKRGRIKRGEWRQGNPVLRF
jgi:hypothetical protein